MARPDTNHEERKGQIVRAALHTFARHGYEGTTNKLIAEEVKQQTGGSFSPALIYHYFESKEELFRGVVEQFPPPHILSQTIKENMYEPPESFFRKVALTYLTLFEDREVASLVKMVITEGGKHPELTSTLAGEIIPQVVVPAIQYVSGQMEVGTLRRTNPLNLLFQFFGALIPRIILASFIDISAMAPVPIPSKEDFIEELVKGYLHGNLLKTE
jgi:AcrR family transcriptional regulator